MPNRLVMSDSVATQTLFSQAPLTMGLEWVAISSSRGSFWPRDPTYVSYNICTGQVDSLALSHLISPLSAQFSSVSVLFDSLWPRDCSTPGLPVHHQLPELTQTHVHGVDDAIQPPHPLSSPFPPAFNLSQHQGLFKWISSSHQVAKVLEFQLQHQSFQWLFKTDFL